MLLLYYYISTRLSILLFYYYVTGADVYIRCRWTNMTALHYGTYFDVGPVIMILLKTTKGIGM